MKNLEKVCSHNKVR